MNNKAAFFKNGHTVNETKPNNFPKEGKKRLTFDIDADLHQYLKLKSINEGKLMRDIIIEAIKKHCDL